MLPNWLYGKSKSKLASILGGGGGTPSDYNQVKAQVTQNAEDIELLSDALDTKAALTQISNPNLLDNPWFTVNQRGQSSYSGNVYGYDRWKLGSSGMSISKSNDIFTVSVMNQYSTLGQKFPIDYIKEGDTYTLSVLFDDDTIESKTFVANANSPSFLGEWTHGNRKFNSLITGQYNNQWQVIPFDYLGSNIETPVTISFKAIKLEKGSVSTLAMDTAPNYATELAKCQRYYQKFTSGPSESLILGLGVANTATTGICTISLPSAMRATPTLRLPNTFSVVVYASGTTITGSSLVINNLENNILQLNAAWSENITAGQVIGIQLLNTAYIALDAEL